MKLDSGAVPDVDGRGEPTRYNATNERAGEGTGEL